MRFASTEEILAATSLNISRRGVFLVTDQPKPIGTPVRLSIEVGGDGKRVDVSGIVIHEASEAHDHRPRGVGIFLTKVPPEWDTLCDRLELSRAPTSPT